MNKKQLIRLAKKKGFDQKCPGNDGIINPFDFYLWMCKLQKWLREEHGLIVEAQSDVSQHDDSIGYNFYFFHHKRRIEIASILDAPIGEYSYNTYELALESGLLEALKHV